VNRSNMPQGTATAKPVAGKEKAKNSSHKEKYHKERKKNHSF